MKNENKVLANMLEGFDSLEQFAAGLDLSFGQKFKLNLTLFVVALYRIFLLPFMGQKTRRLKTGLSNLVDIDLTIPRVKFPDGEGNQYLTDTQISEFEQNGFLKPFQVVSTDAAKKLKELAEKQHETDFDGRLLTGPDLERVLKKHKVWSINYSGIYQALNLKPFRNILQSPAIAHRMASILGEEVICWKTQYFQKPPGSDGTFWHQTSAFREQAPTAKLVPTQPVPQPILQLTVWVALTDVTKENGALRIIPGSFKDGRIEFLQGYAQDNLIDFLARQDKKRLPEFIKAALFSTGAFIRSQALLEASWEFLDTPFENLKVLDLEMKAGEAVIFSSLNMHGSFANTTVDDTRLAFAGRVTANHVKVFPGAKFSYLGTPEGTQPIPLDNISCIQMHGKDSFGFNKILQEEGQ